MIPYYVLTGMWIILKTITTKKGENLDNTKGIHHPKKWTRQFNAIRLLTEGTTHNAMPEEYVILRNDDADRYRLLSLLWKEHYDR